tara:strand:+ start:59 stop:484 length:426 start_codon:yes stop_codon:yes gene_type:complete
MARKFGIKRYEAAETGRKRANGRARTYSKKFEASAPSLGKVALTVAGGAGAGFINSEFPDGIAGIPVPLIAGSVLVAGAIAMSNDNSKLNDAAAASLFAAGQGMLAVAANDMIVNMRQGASTGGILQWGAQTPATATTNGP